MEADALSRLPCSTSHDAAEKAEELGDVRAVFEHMDATPVTSAAIRQWTRTDPELGPVAGYLPSNWPTVVSDGLLPYARRKDELWLTDGCVMWGGRVVVPIKGREEVLKELHSCHPGNSRMKALARSYLWWPGLDQDIEETVRRCMACQTQGRAPVKAPMHPWEWPVEPWSGIHADNSGPVDGQMLFVMVDAHSKRIEVGVSSQATSSVTIQHM